MKPAAQPTLRTPRLELRPFALADSPRVQLLAGDAAVADTTLNLPHPYPDGMAESWIATHRPAWEAGERGAFAIVYPPAGLIGAISIHMTTRHARGELGYWIGREWWGNGFATEAAAELLRFGFRDLGLNRIQARYLSRNPSSGRVMEKLGMRPEGLSPQYFRKGDRFEDVALCAVVRSDWLSRGG